MAGVSKPRPAGRACLVISNGETRVSSPVVAVSTGNIESMAGRRTQQQTERTIALSILGIGTAVSLASLFGGVWIVRAGVALAIIMAVSATYVALRQLRNERTVHRAEVARQLELRNRLVEQHHADSVAMLDRFTYRTENLCSQIDTLRRQLSAAKGELSTMRGNSAWLRGEVAERQARIVALSERVAELEAQLSTQDLDQEDSLVTMPRHGAAALQPNVDDIWSDDEHPTMVDLSSLQLDVALGERKLA